MKLHRFALAAVALLVFTDPAGAQALGDYFRGSGAGNKSAIGPTPSKEKADDRAEAPVCRQIRNDIVATADRTPTARTQLLPVIYGENNCPMDVLAKALGYKVD